MVTEACDPGDTQLCGRNPFAPSDFRETFENDVLEPSVGNSVN